MTAYGLIPEFVGRFPILVSLSALNEDELVQVCTCYPLTFFRFSFGNVLPGSPWIKIPNNYVELVEKA